MTDMNPDIEKDQTSDEVTVETTSVFRADFLSELDAPAQAGTESAVSGVEGLPPGSALLVVKRGPNAGSRFLLDQAITSAGRHPDSDIFLDDVTVSRRHAEFRLENNEFNVVMSGVSTAPTSTASPWIRRCWRTATRSRSASSGWCS